MTNSMKTLMITAAVSGLLGGSTARLQAQPLNGAHLTSTRASLLSSLDATTDKHSCKGKNSCKGQGGCKAGDNGCAGKNSCKGKGGCATDGSKPK